MAKFVLIKGDIIKSKTFDNFPEIFEKKIEEINYPEAVINKFKILKGDEIEGVFKNNLDLIKFIRNLRFSLLPLKIRLIISVIESKDKKELQNNHALFNELENKLNYIGQHRYYKSYFISKNDFTKKSINSIMILLEKLRFEWSKKEWNLYIDYANNQNLKSTAKKYDYELNKVKSISKKLAFEEIYLSELNLKQLLKAELN